MQGSIFVVFTVIITVLCEDPCGKPDFNKLPEEQLNFISPRTRKFVEKLACEHMSDFKLFADEKAWKGETVALENMKNRNAKLFEIHTTHMKNVYEAIGEEGAKYFKKVESLSDKIHEELGIGNSPTIEQLKNEYRSLSVETKRRIEIEFPIFHLENALDIINKRP